MGMTGLIELKWTPADEDLYRTVYAVVMILVNQCFPNNNLHTAAQPQQILAIRNFSVEALCSKTSRNIG
jgi:hypothetical protein